MYRKSFLEKFSLAKRNLLGVFLLSDDEVEGCSFLVEG